MKPSGGPLGSLVSNYKFKVQIVNKTTSNCFAPDRSLSADTQCTWFTAGLFIQPFVSGGSMKLSGGTIEPRVEARNAERGRELGRGVPLPRDEGPGVSPPGKF